jgi:hypothetical protein
MSMSNALIEIKIAAGTWTDIGGVSTKIDVSGGDRKSGEAWTAVGDSPVLTKGKREKFTIKGSVVYTENVSDAWKLLHDAYRNGDDVQVRWTPRGAGTGHFQFSSSTSGNVLKNVSLPSGDIGNGDPILSEFVLETPDVTDAVLA